MLEKLREFKPAHIYLSIAILLTIPCYCFGMILYWTNLDRGQEGGATATMTGEGTPGLTITPSFTFPAVTQSPTQTATITPTFTATITYVLPPTNTPTATLTPTNTSTFTPSSTFTATNTAANTPTHTATNTPTDTLAPAVTAETQEDG